MKIQLTIKQMKALLGSGLLHPSEIACLDLETRNQLKFLCLKMCQPSHCAQCEMQTLCQKPLHDHHASTQVLNSSFQGTSLTQ